MKTALTALVGLLLAAPARGLQLTVIHTNDIHGWIAARPSPREPGRRIGGMAALAAFYEKQGGPKLLLDAGDWFQGTPEGTQSRGQSMIDLFNMLPYDAITIGNHDLDFGQARLQEIVAALKAPVLSANIYDERTHERVSFAKPWIIKEVAGVKVGLFGLLSSDTPKMTFAGNVKGLTFRDEVAEARETVAALQKAGATVIILVDHVGYRQPEMAPFTSDQVIAAEVPGIDLIVGGHMHQFLRHPYRDPKNGTLVVEAGCFLAAAGRVSLDIDDQTGRVRRASSTGELVDLWIDATGEDPKVAATAERYAAAVRQAFDVVIATAPRTLKREVDAESALGDWVTDCERAFSGADVAIQNPLGLRSEMEKGPVLLRTIFDIMPFDNHLVELEMEGRLVREVLDRGVDRSAGLVQASGVSLVYDRDAAVGRRLANVEVGGQPLDDARVYKVVTIDYLTQKGGPFALARRSEVKDTLLRDVLRDCATKQGAITIPAGGRLRLVEGGAR